MDVLILGGGYGTRLLGRYNSDRYYPKGLVQVGGKPCIEHILNTFSDNLFSRIILETNKEGEPFYESWLNDSRFREKAEIFVEDISSPNNCLGVLETIGIVAKHYNFKNPVLVLSPDNLFTENQDGLVAGYNRGARIATYELEHLEDAKKYGVLQLESNKVVGCTEKPQQPTSRIIRTSCEIWDENVFSLLSKWNSNFDSDKVGDFINHLVTNGITVESYKTSGFWIDIGDEEDLKKANNILRGKE